MRLKGLGGYKPMIFGNKNVFAIECEISERIDDWVFGHFLFWLCGQSIGDWEDSTDIKGCLLWLKDFVNIARNRFEEDLTELNKDAVFELLYHSVMQSNASITHQIQNYDDIYSRFHISHIGMSSFDTFSLLLIEQPNGPQRCLWQSESSEEINECYIPQKEMQRVAELCCTWLEQEIATGVDERCST